MPVPSTFYFVYRTRMVHTHLLCWPGWEIEHWNWKLEVRGTVSWIYLSVLLVGGCSKSPFHLVP
jgi:hypothetical protein